MTAGLGRQKTSQPSTADPTLVSQPAGGGSDGIAPVHWTNVPLPNVLGPMCAWPGATAVDDKGRCGQ